MRYLLVTVLLCAILNAAPAPKPKFKEITKEEFAGGYLVTWNDSRSEYYYYFHKDGTFGAAGTDVNTEKGMLNKWQGTWAIKDNKLYMYEQMVLIADGTLAHYVSEHVTKYDFALTDIPNRKPRTFKGVHSSQTFLFTKAD